MSKYITWRPENREPFPFEDRVISQRHLATLGVEVDRDLVWNAANGWSVPRSKISDDAWPYVQGDAGFRIVEEDDEQTPADAETTTQPAEDAGAGDQGMGDARVTAVSVGGSGDTSGASTGATGDAGGTSGGAKGSVGGSTATT